MKFVDPTGLEVLFEGTEEEINTMKTYLEEATGTVITLDEEGHISSFESVDDRFLKFQSMLSKLMESSNVYTVKNEVTPLLGAGSYNPATQTATLDLNAIAEGKYSYNNGNIFNLQYSKFTGKEVIFHELLGHGYDHEKGIFNSDNFLDKKIKVETELNARKRTNEMRELYGLLQREWKSLK